MFLGKSTGPYLETHQFLKPQFQFCNFRVNIGHDYECEAMIILQFCVEFNDLRYGNKLEV